ncbi:MAG: hypothetical protein MUE97_07790, partial [Phycisphaerales bacterium]|nr:hypothetical protein [Phycisphaerales bacterium]
MAQPRTRAKPGLHTAAIACIAPWLSLASAAAASDPPAEPSPDSTATSQPAPPDITLNLGEVFVGLSPTSTSATGRQS